MAVVAMLDIDPADVLHLHVKPHAPNTVDIRYQSGKAGAEELPRLPEALQKLALKSLEQGGERVYVKDDMADNRFQLFPLGLCVIRTAWGENWLAHWNGDTFTNGCSRFWRCNEVESAEPLQGGDLAPQFQEVVG